MGFSEDQILVWFSQYAYQPMLVYGALIGLMVISSFGFPAPEELTLLATGLTCYMGTRPDLYPPPYEGAPVVDVYTAAMIALMAVFLSDFLVFSLGRYFGGRLLKTSYLDRFSESFDKVSTWVKKYGAYAAGAFRFTPGLRFPGHFSCGMLGLSPAKFITVDGFAALISVPTQIFLIATYGETILAKIKQFKLFILAVAIAFVVFLLVRRLLSRLQLGGSL